MAALGAPPGSDRKNIVVVGVARLGAVSHFSRSIGGLQGPEGEGQVPTGRRGVDRLANRASGMSACMSYPVFSMVQEPGTILPTASTSAEHEV